MRAASEWGNETFFDIIEKETETTKKANNICILKRYRTGFGGGYVIVSRYNYTPIKVWAHYPCGVQKLLKYIPLRSIGEAVRVGKKLAKKLQLPLCVSSSLLTMQEAKGLGMF